MFLSTSHGAVLVRLTDEEAAELVKKLSEQLQRRQALIAAEPSMASWNDMVYFNGQLSIGICKS